MHFWAMISGAAFPLRGGNRTAEGLMIARTACRESGVKP